MNRGDIKAIVFIALTLCITIPLRSQQAVPNHPLPDVPKIKGKIIDDSNKPVPYASVALFSSLDSSLITGAASDGEGNFMITAMPGEYFLKVSFLSYEEKTISSFSHNRSGTDLGTLVLVSSALALDEVEVIAERSEMVLQLDKRVFNVGKDLANAGSNAAEILDNIPSVRVDVDGNVSLRGSENVRILVDGKPSGLIGIASTDALEQINGSMIESVEIITNPSARYDAEGEVGIINIILKKEKREGVNGIFDVSVGEPANYNATFSLNYRKRKYNLFTSYGFGYRRHNGKGYSWQEFTGDTTYTYERIRKHERGGLMHNIRFGSDFFLNPKNTFTIAAMYRYGIRDNDASVTYNDFNDDNVLTQTIVRDDNEEETKNNIEGSLSYKKNFKREGHQLTADISYMRSDDTEASDIIELNITSQSSLLQRSENTEDERNLLLQSDYVLPYGTDGKFEAGVKSTFRLINNDYLVEEWNNDIWTALDNFNNHFIYTENIHALYLIGSSKIGQVSYQLGLRTELSEIKTELTETETKNSRIYNDFFPSAHLSYLISKGNSLQLSYSRRLSRPRFRHLLPFYSFVDSRNFFAGNPDLNPEYTNSFEMGYLKQWESGTFLTTLYYRYSTGVIERITTIDSTGFIRILPVNLSTQDAFGAEFNISLRPVAWLNMNCHIDFYRAITSGNYENIELSSNTYRWDSRLSAKIKLFRDVDFQNSFMYRAPSKTTQGKIKSMYMLDSGISKDIMKGNGTLSLKVRDLLNSSKWRNTVQEDNFYMESEYQWRTRQVVLSFNYRLNQKKRMNREYNEGVNDNDMEF